MANKVVCIDDSTVVSVRCFLSRSAMLERDIATGGVSVRLPVLPAHAGNESKRMTVGSFGVQHRASKDL